MAIPLRLLILEDNLSDAELMLYQLRSAGYSPDWQCVDNEEDFRAALSREPQLILADYHLPQYDAVLALDLLKKSDLDIPFIVVTGSISEEVAVDVMRQGASDYLLKDRMTRLGQAVAHVLEEHATRQEKREAEHALLESEARFRRLADNAEDVIYRFSFLPIQSLEYISPAITTVTGFTPEELYIQPELIYKLVYAEDHTLISLQASSPMEVRLVHKDGRVIWTEQRFVLLHNAEGRLAAVEGISRDITQRKQMEEKLKEERILLWTLIDNLPDHIYAKDVQGRKIISNNADWQASGGKKREDVIGKTDFDFYPAEIAENYWAGDKAVIDSAKSIINREEPGLDQQGHPVWLLSSKVPLLDSQGKVAGLVGIGRDISERKLAEEKIRSQLNRLAVLREVDSAITGSMSLKVVLNMILAQTANQLGIDAANILLLDWDIQTLVYYAGRGFRTEALQHTRLRLGEGYAGRAALEKHIVHIPDLRGRKTDFLRAPEFYKEGFFCYYGVPLLAEGKVQGVLEVFQRSALNPGKDWLDFLQTLAGQAAIAIYNTQLFEGLKLSNLELQLAYDATIEGWSQAMDMRDKETEGHTLRVTKLTVRLARAIGMSEDEIIHVQRGALLHDIGKLAVPDTILLKAGELTDEEWALMKQHPQFAYNMLSPIAYLRPALNIPYCHHEKWDGSGYPRGLVGNQIPLEARIFCIIDVWDALLSDRPYRLAWSKEKTLKYLKEQAGAHFDPEALKKTLPLLMEY